MCFCLFPPLFSLIVLLSILWDVFLGLGAFFENHVAFIRSSKGVKDCGERFTDNFLAQPALAFCVLGLCKVKRFNYGFASIFFFWVKVTNEL